MATEFDFLEKHFCDTNETYLAAQEARERFGNYPPARESTVIYGIPWDTLLGRIIQAVENFSYSDIFDVPCTAFISEHKGRPQWVITLTGLRFVNATVQAGAGGIPEYTIKDYKDGLVTLMAEVTNSQPPRLGEIVHLAASTGTQVGGPIPIKNP
jgi:hypothetical protein